MKLLGAWASEVGLVRSINEDSYLVDSNLNVFAVADGVGGHRGGEVASSTAIETLRASMANGTTVEEAIRAANTAVYERSMRDPELFGMGTTMTVAVPLSGFQLLLGHVGDSRAYLCRGGVLSQITDDHSMVGELVRDGQITADQAAIHPQRNVITRAVGMEPTVDVDLVTLEVKAGDRLLLCSDGITDMLHNSAIERALAAATTPQECAETLADQALENGGIDNLTAVVFDIVSVEDDGIGATETEVDPIETVRPSGPFSAEPSLVIPQQSFERPRRELRSRIRWLFVSIVPLLLVIGAAFGGLRYVGAHRWFVGSSNGHVALFRGSRDTPLAGTPRLVAVNDALVTHIPEPVLRDQVAANAYCKTSNEQTARTCFNTIARSTAPTPTTVTSTTVPTTTTATTAPTTTSSTKKSP